jgi:hypothetical protein
MPLYERFSAPHQLHSTRPADFRLLMPAGKPVSDERAVDVSIKCGCKFTSRRRLQREAPELSRCGEKPSMRKPCAKISMRGRSLPPYK